MKKLIISVVAIATSVMAMATEEAYVRIRLTGVSGASSVVRLTQDDARTPAYESGYDSEKIMSQANSKSVLIYGLIGEQKCEDIMTNSLNGVKLGFVTNNVDATGYTLKFENVSGLPLKLYDLEANQVIDIVDNGTYVFDAPSGRIENAARFVIANAPQGICFNYNILDINGYAGKSLTITEAATGTVIDNVASLPVAYSKDLSAYTGRLVVTLNGVDYQIDANPAVTVVP